MIKNEVYVSRQLDSHQLWRQELMLTEEHWIQEPPHEGGLYDVRIRHRAPLVKAKVSFVSGGVRLELAEPIRAAAPGQSVVIYEQQVVVGGGIIKAD